MHDVQTSHQNHAIGSLWRKGAAAMLAGVMLVASVSVDARRMGGGSSFGRQSGNVTQRQQAPQAPVQQPGAQRQQAQPQQSAAANRPTQQPAAPAARKPWGGILGGLAAGLGLAALFSWLGMGGQLADMLGIALMVLLAMVVIGFVIRMFRRQPATPAAGPRYAYSGPSYEPANLGNEAAVKFDGAAAAAPAASSTQTEGRWAVPAGFDTAGFLNAAKNNFVLLQKAWDQRDLATLGSVMTDEMLANVKTQLDERDQASGGSPNQTDVLMLNAELLGIEDLGDAYMASVEFSGMIREDVSAGASPFREVWNMTKPKNGSVGWLVAGVQAFQ